MKNIILTVITMFIAIGLSGCTPALLDGVSPEGKAYNGAINRKVDSTSGIDLKIFTMEESDPKIKFDMLIKAAAKDYKKRGVEYFSLSTLVSSNNAYVNSGMNHLITNSKDTMDYCFPNAFGLEKKCKPLENEKIVLYFRGEQKDYFRPQWSVKEVLATVTQEDKELVLKEVESKELLRIK